MLILQCGGYLAVARTVEQQPFAFPHADDPAHTHGFERTNNIPRRQLQAGMPQASLQNPLHHEGDVANQKVAADVFLSPNEDGTSLEVGFENSKIFLESPQLP